LVSDPGRDDPPAQTPIATGLRAGTVGRAHGLDGSFHVGAAVEEVVALLEVGSELLVGGHPRRIARLAGHGARPIVRLEGADSREDAEALRGLELEIPRSAAPPLQEDEWWAEDLEGCTVRDGDRTVGVVTALLGLPSCDVLEVRRDGAGDGRALLVPLIRDAVRAVDPDARVIEIDLAFLGEE
jgi:16S rRNA processing protein RimM